LSICLTPEKDQSVNQVFSKNKKYHLSDTLDDISDDTRDDIFKNPNFRLFPGDIIPHPDASDDTQMIPS
jgi:hypothetical protein